MLPLPAGREASAGVGASVYERQPLPASCLPRHSYIYGPTPFARHLIIDVRENHCSHISGLLVEDFSASWPRWLFALILLIIRTALPWPKYNLGFE